MQGPDVMRFAEVVPRKNLHELRLQVEHLLPPRMPQPIALPYPVLVVPYHVGVEPWTDGHDVRFVLGFQGGDVLLVCGRVHRRGPVRPGAPGE